MLRVSLIKLLESDRAVKQCRSRVLLRVFVLSLLVYSVLKLSLYKLNS